MKISKPLRLLVWLVLVFSLAIVLVTHRAFIAQGKALTAEGSPAPQLQADSKTGYAGGQRHFLGTFERGETYRWIAHVQDVAERGGETPRITNVDTYPEERPVLLPKLYAFWLLALSGAVQFFTGSSLGRSVEEVAWLEPLVAHALSLVLMAWLLRGRLGDLKGALGLALYATLPAWFDQFLPGVLSPRAGAMVCSAAVLILLLPRQDSRVASLGVVSALFGAAALWLDPSIGAPVLLAATIVAVVCGEGSGLAGWGLRGAAFALVAWYLDGTPAAVEASELRTLHPVHAIGWFAVSFLGYGWHHFSRLGRKDLSSISAMVAGALALVGVLGLHLGNGLPGCWQPDASWHRVTSMDETLYFSNPLQWILEGAGRDRSAWVISLGVFCFLVFWRSVSKHGEKGEGKRLVIQTAVCALALMWTLAHPRAVPLFVLVAWAWSLARIDTFDRRALRVGVGVVLVALAANGAGWTQRWDQLKQALKPEAPAPAHYHALINRHLAHWLTRHTPPDSVVALAAPELSDSLIFHGNGRAVMSTAWRAYSGRVAASRLLSAPEEGEAEAILASRGITHLLHVSWDQTLAKMVRVPASAPADSETFLARLDRWVYPLVLRPLPYVLPGDPHFVREKAAVFAVTPVQDEGLQLARLAEYFVEVQRLEPAGAVAEVLRSSYQGDVNSTLAQGLEAAARGDARQVGRSVELWEKHLDSGTVPEEWDRRVQGAILLALGKRHDRAKAEVVHCLEVGTAADVYRLTPLQAFRLGTLIRAYKLGEPGSVMLESLERQAGALAKTERR